MSSFSLVYVVCTNMNKTSFLLRNANVFWFECFTNVYKLLNDSAENLRYGWGTEKYTLKNVFAL